MSWKPIGRLSLRGKLFALLLPALALLAGSGLWLTRQDAIAAANAAYDRSLLGAIKALESNVSTASGGLAIELPYRLFEFFELTASGSVYFRVASSDGLVELGHPDLPLPPGPVKSGEPVFYDARYFGEAVRIGAYQRALHQPAGASGDLMIQIAESTASRDQFTRTFVVGAALREAGFLALLVVVLAAVLTLGLRPVARLAAQVGAREPDDLRPLEAADLPTDIAPLVVAVNRQIERTEHLTAQRRQFLDDASHQLRTPLATLRAQLDHALREPDTAAARHALDALSSQLDDATHATNQFLALARSDASPPHAESFDLHALVRDVALALLPQARARAVDFGIDEGATPAPAEGDPALLREALANLAQNAIVHGASVVTLRAAAAADGYSLGVVDNGPGIAPELQGRIGERFAKGRGSRGAGLGLAIARSVAERHGGALRLVPGDGGRGLVAELHWPRTS
jgi:two-component system sensor histidine kinase TctE